MDTKASVKVYKVGKKISKWAYDQTYALTKNDIFEGTPMVDFVPKDEMNIGEVLQMFYNID